MDHKKQLFKIANEYPDRLVNEQISDIERTNYHMNLVLESFDSKLKTELEICDLGGGLSPFSIICAENNFKRVVLVDDFDDSANRNLGEDQLKLHKKYGIEIFTRDLLNQGLKNIEGNFDIISTFDSMEHWHNSPKRLFHEVMDKLKKDGIFIIGVPNCVNLRKRITVPFGYGKWSSIESWYEEEKFRNHVREPDVGDLFYIAKDINLKDIKIYGRNWLGLSSTNNFVKNITKVVDPVIRFFPSLCSNLYLVGRKK